MRNTIKSLLLVSLVVIGFSCKDDSLDPLQFNAVGKGTLLALRGTQLDRIYNDGEQYGDELYVEKVTSSDAFDFDAEFLATDPSSLESCDVFVIKQTGSGSTLVTERILVTNIPASQFKTTADYLQPWTTVSIKATDILSKIGIDASLPADQTKLLDQYTVVDDDGVRSGGINIEVDLNLKDGTKKLAKDVVNVGLFASNQFYPAQKLLYGVRSVDDYRTSATTALRGQYSVVSGKVVRTVLPLKSGAVDTLNITFDQAIATPPTVSVSPASSGTLGTVTAVAGKNNAFYVIFTAGGTYTGNATITIDGATSAETGALAGLVQYKKTATIAVDNLAPALVSFTTGTRVGFNQSATITLKFNEALGSAPKVSIDPGATNMDAVTNASMTLSSDGLTATYVYDYKDSQAPAAVHGNMSVSFTGGKDRAGNNVPAITPKDLTVDIGAAPAPSIALDGTQYDWGTQIKWTITYATNGLTNPGGSTSGTVYFVAVTSGAAAPVGFVGGDVPAFTMASGVSAKQTGSVAIVSGTSDPVFSTFTANGTLDVYAVFVSSTGVIGAISAPTTVTMN